MLVLPDNDGVLVQVGDVGAANTLGVLLHDHPAKMAVEKSLADAVWVLVGVGVAVVGTVVAAPPADGTLNSTAANKGKEDAEWERGVVGLVCPEAMVASCDAETSPEVVYDGPEGGLLGVAVRLRGARHGRRLLDVVGVDGHHAGGRLVGRHTEGVVER